MSLNSRKFKTGNKQINVGLAPFHSFIASDSPANFVSLPCVLGFVLLEDLILEFGVGGHTAKEARSLIK